MRQLIVLALLLVPSLCGCGSAAQDVAAAKEYVRGSYSNPDIDFRVDKVEGPEYAQIERIPRDRLAKEAPDRSAACAVRVWFTWRIEGRTTHDSSIVWVSKDHKGVGVSNPTREEWRKFVQSVAKNPAPAHVAATKVVSQPEPPKPTAKSRLWTKADRSAIVRATFLSLSGNVVELRKWDGMDVRISLDQLSQADRDWVEENRPKD